MNFMTAYVAQAGVSEHEVVCTHWIRVDIGNYEPMSLMCLRRHNAA